MEELTYGSPAHLPLKAAELMEWIAYDQIAAEERRKAEQEARG